MIVKKNIGWGRSALVCLTAVVLLLLPAVAGSTEMTKVKGAADETLAATVDGEPIYMEDLNSPEIYKERRKLYKLEQQRLRRMVAAKLRKSKPKEFGAPDISISEEEIREVFKDSKLKSRGPLSAYREQIEVYLTRRKNTEIDTFQYDLAVAKGYVKIRLRAPPVYLFRIEAVERKASQGPRNAPVRIDEFSDFQCPFCRKVYPTLQALMKKYPGQIRLTYRHLPLEGIHSKARRAAEASECAAEQDKFWPFHDLLFANPSRMDEEHLVAHAENIKLDMGAFNTCLKNGTYANRVSEDMAVADSLNITGTPGFVIGRKNSRGMLEGEILTGARPLGDFVEVVEKFLKPGKG